MTIDRLSILSRLEGYDPSDSIIRARAFLAADDLKAVSDRPVRIKVSEALRLWETRLKNTTITNRSIQGAATFVGQLRMLDPNVDLEQVGFISPKYAGNVFFDDKNGKFVGLVLVERSGPPL
jgi:hypothetical protein